MVNIMKKINGFDCDGVLSIGIHPGPNDVIITGRSYEESEETAEFFVSKGIKNLVYYSPAKFDDKTREISGNHKGNTIKKLYEMGTIVQVFFEDDKEQFNIIKGIISKYDLPTKLVWVDHDGLIDLENKRHHENLPKV